MELSERAQLATGTEAMLWDTYGQRIYRYLLRLTDQPETAEDLTQETFLLAIRHLRRTHRSVEHEAAWIFRIATNLLRDHWRRRRLIAWLPFLDREHEAAVPDQSDALAQRELVGQALRRLPPDTAAMLLLKDGEGFSTREVAMAVGLEYEAARKRLARARILFRTEYQRLGGEQV